MTTERVPTIAELIETWREEGLGHSSGLYPSSDPLVAALEAREHEVLAAAKAEAAASALEQATYRIRNFSEPGNVEGTANWVSQLSPIPDAKALWEAEARLVALQDELKRFTDLRRQERIRIAGRHSDKFAASDIAESEVSQFHSPITDTLTNVVTLLGLDIAALTALREAEARLAEAKRWHMHHGKLMSHSINECGPCARIFELESAVAKLREGK